MASGCGEEERRWDEVVAGVKATNKHMMFAA
jgi:hypothetical protein